MPSSVVNYRSILFDFDYTLGDTTDGIVGSVNFALSSIGRSSMDAQPIKRTVGYPLRTVYKMLTGDEDENNISNFIDFFKIEADKIMTESAVLYDGVPELLKNLKNNNISIGIVSGKHCKRISDIMNKFNLLEYVDVIVGSDIVTEPKPSPEGLLYAMNVLSSKPEETVFVGDSLVDAQAAYYANVDFIAVLTGVWEANDFHNPKAVLENVREVIKHVL